jgi:hypothetical protein
MKMRISPTRTSSKTALETALAVVKAAGYRVSKPRTRKVKDRVGPTFVAQFSDGQVTRMSTFTSLENLDWKRGVRLSQAAYESRCRHARCAPPIVSAHFEQDGKTLATCDRQSVLRDLNGEAASLIGSAIDLIAKLK